MAIPVIDLFAGPGGLGEGFSALQLSNGKSEFTIKLSIEKDVFAHRTLELRAFFRVFKSSGAPKEYYDYVSGKIDRETLFTKYKSAAKKAACEAWHAELGSKLTTDESVDQRIHAAIGKRKG